MRDIDTRSGVGTLDVLQIIFIVLKMFNLIDWSWWVVFSPTWTLIGILAVILIAEKLIDR
ncbi:MAG: hypothetical protein IKG37_04410 [Solobacterium sp.]|nr:hypothetical protein [Solobacterium sp.]